MPKPRNRTTHRNKRHAEMPGMHCEHKGFGPKWLPMPHMTTPTDDTHDMNHTCAMNTNMSKREEPSNTKACECACVSPHASPTGMDGEPCGGDKLFSSRLRAGRSRMKGAVARSLLRRRSSASVCTTPSHRHKIGCLELERRLHELADLRVQKRLPVLLQLLRQATLLLAL